MTKEKVISADAAEEDFDVFLFSTARDGEEWRAKCSCRPTCAECLV